MYVHIYIYILYYWFPLLMLVTGLSSVANLQAKGGGNACSRNSENVGQNAGSPSNHFFPN